VALITLDHRYHRLDQIRAYLSYAVYPLQWAVDMPVRLTHRCGEYCASYKALVKENEKLRQEQFLQNARLQKVLSLESENVRLHSLLQSAVRVGETHRVADIIQVDADPYNHNIILNKGKNQNVLVGQPILDAQGVMGEIIEVNAVFSRAILITDPSHAVPVENVRNGVRGVVIGTGNIDGLELQHVPTTADIKVGDILVTSGLGGRYPVGYPVGTITRIEQDPSESFAKVQVTPAAQLERGRQVLLVECQATNQNINPPAVQTAEGLKAEALTKAKDAKK
jgi:rod shape-determining protein MreC